MAKTGLQTDKPTKLDSLNNRFADVRKALTDFGHAMPEYYENCTDYDLDSGELELLVEYRDRLRDACQALTHRVDRLNREVTEQLVTERRGY